MNIFLKRNLKLFFRDRSAVFFSLLAVFIIVALYAVFLGDVWLPDSMQGLENVDFLMNSWLISGLLTVTSVTTTMGAFGVLIDDKVKKIDKDFYSSPIKKSNLTKGYLGSALLIGIIMSLVTFGVSEAYIVLNGGHCIDFSSALKTILLIFLTSTANTSLMCFIVSFFKSHHAFSTAGTVIGTLIGFLTGIYLPIGNLPESVQTVIKVFPVSHGAALFRQVLMEDPLDISFHGIETKYLSEFKEYMGITYSFGDHVVSPFTSILILVGTSVIFYGLSVLNLSRKSVRTS
ncbi:ABC transporter permease [Anaerotignum sp.]|uniref:ABC transporter permease n=1 Tax=Anaerotignum sp. TaxID=2039241 RepID=UPI002714E689|nr:ABC transporter permease [Anaerotignum sp.]